MPAWLAWLLPVLLAPAGAIAWTAWSGRSRGPAGTEDTLQAHERFRKAFSEPVPRSSRPSRRPGPATRPAPRPPGRRDPRG